MVKIFGLNKNCYQLLKKFLHHSGRKLSFTNSFFFELRLKVKNKMITKKFLAVLVYYCNGFLVNIVYIYIAKNWSNLMKNWSKMEEKFNHYHHQPNITIKINCTAGIVLTAAISIFNFYKSSVAPQTIACFSGKCSGILESVSSGEAEFQRRKCFFSFYSLAVCFCRGLRSLFLSTFSCTRSK